MEKKAAGQSTSAPIQIDEEMQILDEHINPNKTSYLPAHTRRRVEYALRTAWATAACLILLQFFQWTPVATELSPVISIISTTLFFGAWQQAAFKVFYSSIIGASLGAFIVGPSFRIPGLQLVLLFVVAGFLNSIKQWDRLPKVISSLTLVLGSLFPNLTNGQLTLHLTLYASLALVLVPFFITGVTLLFPMPAFSLFNAKNLVLIICRKLTLMSRALIRAFPSGAYLDLYIAEYDELYSEVCSDVNELKQMLGLLSTERILLDNMNDMIAALTQFLTIIDKVLLELNGIRDCVSALIQSPMQNQFNELLLDTLVEIDEEVEIAFCVAGEFFDTFLPLYLDNCICRCGFRVARECAKQLRHRWGQLQHALQRAFPFGANWWCCCFCCSGSGSYSRSADGQWKVESAAGVSECDTCESHIAEERRRLSAQRGEPNQHPLNSPFKRPESINARRASQAPRDGKRSPNAGYTIDDHSEMKKPKSSMHALRHRSRVRKIYNIPFSCDLIEQHEERAGHHLHSHAFRLQKRFSLSAFNHYSLSLSNVNCEMPESDRNKSNCATCAVAAPTEYNEINTLRGMNDLIKLSVRDDDCSNNEARRILEGRFAQSIMNLHTAQTTLLHKYQEGRGRFIILPFSPMFCPETESQNEGEGAYLDEADDADAAAAAAVAVAAGGESLEQEIGAQESISAKKASLPPSPRTRVRPRGFTLDSVDPTGPPLCSSFQPARRNYSEVQYDSSDGTQLDALSTEKMRQSKHGNDGASNGGGDGNGASAGPNSKSGPQSKMHSEKIRLDLRNLGRRASYVHRLCVFIETVSSLKVVFTARGLPWSLWNDGLLPNVRAVLDFANTSLLFWYDIYMTLGSLVSELRPHASHCSAWGAFLCGIWNRLMKPFLLDNMQALKVAAATSVAASLLIFNLAPSLYKDGLWTAAVIPLIRQDEASASFLTSYQRLEGTVIGSLFAFFIFKIFGCGTLERQCSPTILLPVIIAWVALCGLFREGPRHGYAATVAGFTPIILLLGLQTDLLGAWGRIEETFVGIAIYLLIDNLIFPRRTYTMLKASVLQCIDETRWLFSDSIRAAQVLLSLTDESNTQRKSEQQMSGTATPGRCSDEPKTSAALHQPVQMEEKSDGFVPHSVVTSARVADAGGSFKPADLLDISPPDVPPSADLMNISYAHSHDSNSSVKMTPHQYDYRTIERATSFTISANSMSIFSESLTYLDKTDMHLRMLAGNLQKQSQWLAMVVHEPDLWYRAVPTSAYEKLTKSFEGVLRAGHVVSAGYRAFSSLLIQMLGRKEALQRQLYHYNFFIKHSFYISEEAEKALCLAHNAFRRLYEKGEFHADLSHIVILRRSADSLLRMSHQHFLEVYMRRPPEELLAINPYLNVAWQNLFEGVFTLAEEVSALGMTLHSIRNIEALVSV